MAMDEMNAALSSDVDSAFPRLVESMGPRLYWGLRRMTGHPQEAEDLTQETFIRAYKAITTYDEQRVRGLQLSPWLWTIALNLGRNHLRSRSRRPTLVEMEEHGHDDPDLPDGEAWDRRLATLSGPQRKAVVLRHVAGLSIREISQATGRAEGTVKADIHRGLSRLREEMEREDDS